MEPPDHDASAMSTVGSDQGRQVNLVRQHYAWLDWIRFAAAFLVVLTHARSYHWVDYAALSRAGLGGGGKAFFAFTGFNLEPVVVFFVLSGFLVGGKVLERIASGAFDARSYAIDRFTRIYLPLIPALLLSALVARILGKSVLVTEFAGNALSLQGIYVSCLGGNGPLWSLPYEVWLYVCAGGIALAACGAARAPLYAFCLVCLSVTIFMSMQTVFLLCWLLGLAAYPLRSKPISQFIVAAATAIFIAGLLGSQLQFRNILPPGFLGNWPSRHACLLAMSAGGAVLIAWLSGLPSKDRPMIRFQRLGTALAAFAYTLFLTHFPVLQLWNHYDSHVYERADLESFTLFLAKVAGCLLVAWLLFLPFERQTNKVRRFILARSQRRII